MAVNNGYGIDAGQTLDFGNVGPGETTDIVWAIHGGSADIGAQVVAL